MSSSMYYLFMLTFIFQIAIFIAGVIISFRKPAGGLNGTDRQLPLCIRIILSLSLAVTAMAIWANLSGKDAIYSLLVFIGMSFSFIGDLVMAGVIKFKDRLVCGMMCFAITHVLYISAYINTIHAHGRSLIPYAFYAIIVFWIISTSGWMKFIKNKQKPKEMNSSALIYGTLISTMVSFAATLALILGGKWWITCFAAVIFMCSDMLIGVTEIGSIKIKNVSILVWVTYVAAQMGIVYSVLLS